VLVSAPLEAPSWFVAVPLPLQATAKVDMSTAKLNRFMMAAEHSRVGVPRQALFPKALEVRGFAVSLFRLF
jgi:hypothetical protein